MLCYTQPTTRLRLYINVQMVKQEPKDAQQHAGNGKMAGYKKRKKDIDATVREEFARRIIYNRDATGLIEEFLISRIENERLNQYVRINLDKFITMYSLNVLHLDTSH